MVHSVNELGIDVVPRSRIRRLRIDDIYGVFIIGLTKKKGCCENACILVFGRFFFPPEADELSPAIASPVPAVDGLADVEGFGWECHEL